MRLPAPALGLLTAALLASPVAAGKPPADDSGWGDDDFGGEGPGFDDFEDVEVEPPPPPSPWSLTGFLRSDQALWMERLDERPLAKARQSLDLVLTYRRDWFRLHLGGHAEYDLAWLVDRDDRDEPTLDAYEWKVDSREALVALSPGDFEIVLGRQIVAWGEGDALSPLDVVNPRDLREPGLADLEDLRLPVLATRVSWFHGFHRVEAMVVHESWWGYRPAPLSPYSPFRKLILDDPLAAGLLQGRTLDWEHEQERFALDQQQGMLRWVYRGEGLDLGLYAASVLDQQGVVLLAPEEFAGGSREVDIRLDHRRFTVVGHSGAWPWEDLLVKWEAGARIDHPLNVGRPPDLDVAERTLLDTMLGLTWTPTSDLRWALEVWKPWLVDPPDDLLYDVDAPLIALRGTWTTLRERLELHLAATAFGWTADLGWLLRGEITWKPRDDLAVGGGYITYQPTSEFGPVYGLERHDRLFATLRWDFGIL
ncbi:MAG: DUF1302 family protein [Myxococcota bacterium]